MQSSSIFIFFLITTFGRMNRPSFKRTKLINSCISDFYCIPNFSFTSSFTERPERDRILFYFIKFNKPLGLHLLNIYLFMGYRGTILQYQGCLRNILVEKIITGFWSESLPSPLSRYSLQHGSVQVKTPSRGNGNVSFFPKAPLAVLSNCILPAMCKHTGQNQPAVPQIHWILSIEGIFGPKDQIEFSLRETMNTGH